MRCVGCWTRMHVFLERKPSSSSLSSLSPAHTHTPPFLQLHFDDGHVQQARILAADPLSDIGLLKIVPHGVAPGSPPPAFPHLALGKASDLEPGEGWLSPTQEFYRRAMCAACMPLGVLLVARRCRACNWGALGGQNHRILGHLWYVAHRWVALWLAQRTPNAGSK